MHVNTGLIKLIFLIHYGSIIVLLLMSIELTRRENKEK